MKKLLAVVLVLAAAAGGYWWFVVHAADERRPHVRYRTAVVDRGEVVEGVAATGTVEPVELVQVGTQISGVIQEMHADFNSHVKAGQVLARLDSRRLEAQVAQDAAAVERAKADAERARAAVTQSKADVDRSAAVVTAASADVARVDALLTQARSDLDRQRGLVAQHVTGQADLDAAVASRGSLEAQRASAEAAVKQARAAQASAAATVAQNEAQAAVAQATITQAAATLKGDQVNLDYATIVSPVDGVVVSRNVDVGQTVAASLQAPTLFVVAQDLTKVQIQVSVPEADVGRVREKQPARFTVDAYPERAFQGTVSQLRLAATTVSNVVTYPVVVDAANPEGLLLPGMTATVTFEVATSPKDALRVPATALRLQPTPDLVIAVPAATHAAAETAATPAGGRPGGGGRSGGVRSGGKPARGGDAGTATVYVLAGGNRLWPVAVKPGVSDGTTTAVEPVEPGTLDVGTEVVTAVIRETEASTTTNPFAPPRLAGGRGGR